MEKATKNIYKKYLLNMLNDEDYAEMVFDGNMAHAIYIIDDIVVGGGFDEGLRSVDHGDLLEIDYSFNNLYIKVEGRKYSMTWCDILNWGVVIVPETQSYISDSAVSELEELGYSRLPLNNNHIVGFK